MDAAKGLARPSLLVVAPCLNEEAHLDALLAGLRADRGCRDALLVVADGGSTDRSRDIVLSHAAQDPRVRLLDNPKRLQSAGVNLAVATHGVGVERMIRVDVHADYPPDYCAQLLAIADETGADSVVVSMRAEADTQSCFQRATAAAQNSVLGVGGSRHRKAGGRQWIDHGHHALFKTEAFRAVGGYDEGFSHNEDAELDVRLIKAGRRILLAGDLLITYHPRATPRALLRQYASYGRGRASTVLLHRQRLKLRQVLPLAVLPALVAAVAGPIAPIAAAPALLWASACVVGGLVVGLGGGGGCAFASGIPAALMHAAWSFGFWRRLIQR